jgi:hypothetical protein
MPITDLNKPLDFARATLGNAGGLLSLFQRDPKLWDIYEAEYNKVVFHVFSTKQQWGGALSRVTDRGGRRKVKYMFPYKDGQTTDDLGRKPGSFVFEIVLHGANYQVALEKLLTEFNDPVPGNLWHPIWGEMTVSAEDWEITFESAARKAAALKVTFIEHNFTMGEFTSDLDSTTKGAIAKALAIFQKIDNAIVTLRGLVLFANNVKSAIETLLAQYKTKNAIALQKMNRTFNNNTSSDIPSLLPTNLGGTGAVGGTFPTVTSPSDPFASVPVADLKPGASAPSTVEELAKIVNQLREDVGAIIEKIETSPVVTGAGTSGALAMYDDIVALKQTAVLMQAVLETGIASSQARTINYTTPRLQTIREVAYANGLKPDDGDRIALLNPSLLSLNFIAKGTVLKIPMS